MDVELLFISICSFENESDYNKIIMPMKEHYKNQTDFKLIIETKELVVGKINIQSLYYLSSFLNSLKKHKIQYLKKTTIKIYHIYCYDLLYCLFTYLSVPLAQVEVMLYNGSNIERIKSFFPKKLK